MFSNIQLGLANGLMGPLFAGCACEGARTLTVFPAFDISREDDRRYGVEMKFQDAPRLTLSMRIAMEDLDLGGLTVFYLGDLSNPPIT
jgi:hypothetical protein